MNTFPTYRQLRYLVAVDEARHFGRAADRCGISQPSLSLQIGNLEDLLQTRLVERGRGAVTLTPAGREVVERARRIGEEMQAIVDRAPLVSRELQGTLRLGTTTTIGPYLLPLVVERLHRAHPGLRLYVREAAPKVLRQELLDGQHDLTLTQLPETGRDLREHRLFREPLMLALPEAHELTAREMLSVDDLAGLRVLSLGPAYALHDQIAAICREHQAELLRDYEGTSLDALRQMVGMGMGVTFLPRLYVLSEVERRALTIATRPFRSGAVSRTIGLVWRRNSPNAEPFQRIAEIIRAVAREEFAPHLQL